VYKSNEALLSLNPPALELDPVQVPVADVPGLLPGVAVQVLSDLQAKDAGGATSEIWRVVLVLSLLFMILELVLLLGERLPSAQTSDTPGRKEAA